MPAVDGEESTQSSSPWMRLDVSNAYQQLLMQVERKVEGGRINRLHQTSRKIGNSGIGLN